MPESVVTVNLEADYPTVEQASKLLPPNRCEPYSEPNMVGRPTVQVMSFLWWRANHSVRSLPVTRLEMTAELSPSPVVAPLVPPLAELVAQVHSVPFSPSE